MLTSVIKAGDRHYSSKGDAGVPFTTVTTQFLQPAINSTVVVGVADNAIAAVGLMLFVEVAGMMEVTAIPAAGQVTLKNLNISGNAIAGTTIVVGKKVVSGVSEGFATQSGITGIDDLSDALAIWITAAEFVGIGVGAPFGRLHIKNGESGAAAASVTADELTIEDSAFAGISILTGASGLGSVVFGDLDNDNIGRVVYSHLDDSFEIFTNDVEAVHISSVQRVGLGLSTPLGRLHARSADSTVATVDALADDLIVENDVWAGMTFLGGNAGGGSIYFGCPTDDNAGQIIYAHSDDSLKFVLGGQDRLFLKGTTYGFNTNIPDGFVHLHKASAGAVTADADADELVIEDSDNAGISILTPTDKKASIHFQDSDGISGKVVYDHTTNLMGLWAGGSEIISLRKNNVVIGKGMDATASAARLWLYAEDSGTLPTLLAGTSMVIESDSVNYLNFISANGGIAGLLFGDQAEAYSGRVLYDHTTDNLEITADVLHMIGGASGVTMHGSTILAVEGANGPFIELMSSDTSTTGLRFNTSDAGGSDLLIYWNPASDKLSFSEEGTPEVIMDFNALPAFLIKAGNSTIAPHAASVLVVEHSSGPYIEFLSSDNTTMGLRFNSDDASVETALIYYNPVADRLAFQGGAAGNEVNFNLESQSYFFSLSTDSLTITDATDTGTTSGAEQGYVTLLLGATTLRVKTYVNS